MHSYCSGEVDSSFVRRTPSYLIHGVGKRVGEVRGSLQYRYNSAVRDTDMTKLAIIKIKNNANFQLRRDTL